MISRLITSVKHENSVRRIKSRLFEMGETRGCLPVEIWQEQRNLEAIQSADIILVSCQSAQVAEILTIPGVNAALSGKLLISVCLGISTKVMATLLDLESMQRACTLIYAMPNTASAIQQSSTIICEYDSEPGRANAVSDAVTHVFSSIGTFNVVPEIVMTPATITAASTPAFFALALEGVIQGALSAGVPRENATIMAAQAMKGAAGLVLAGESPKTVMQQVMTPGGCTECGVNELKSGGVLQAYAESVKVAVKWSDALADKARE